MSDVIISPNMSLPVPIVGVDPGPDWAQNINASLSIIDQHDHSPGRGVLVTPSGLNINANLAIQDNNLTTVKTVNFQAQPGTLTGIAPNLGCVYVAGNELIYNDEAGNIVQITNNGSVNAGAGSITGLPSGTASASYSAGGKTFTWQSSTNTAAAMDNGPVTIRQILTGANGVTINSPNSLAASYDIFLPAGVPLTTLPVSMDSSGNLSTGQITTSQIADGSVTSSKIASLAISPSQINANNVVVPAPDGADHNVNNVTSGAFLNSVTITASGTKNIMVGLNANYIAANTSYLTISSDFAGAPTDAYLEVRDGPTTILSQSACGLTSGVFQLNSFFFLVSSPSAGSHTYNIAAHMLAVGPTLHWSNAGIYAYEID